MPATKKVPPLDFIERIIAQGEDNELEGSSVNTDIVTGSTNGRIRISGDDSSTEYLEDKIVAGSNITLTKIQVGDIEQLQISSSGGDGGISVVTQDPISPTDGTVWILASTAQEGNITCSIGGEGAEEVIHLSITPADENNISGGTGLTQVHVLQYSGPFGDGHVEAVYEDVAMIRIDAGVTVTIQEAIDALNDLGGVSVQNDIATIGGGFMSSAAFINSLGGGFTGEAFYPFTGGGSLASAVLKVKTADGIFTRDLTAP